MSALGSDSAPRGRGGVRRLVLAAALFSAVLAAGAPSASARSAWWHLSSGSRPTDLHAGASRDEVQEVTVSATEGAFALVNPVTREFALLEWDAPRAEVQEQLEAVYGAGNVEVPEGQGNATGSEPYKIIFKGALADQPVPDMLAFPFGLNGEVTIAQQTIGRPDGWVVATAINLGDGGAEGEANPIKLFDRLPHGVRPVAVEGAVVGDGDRSAITLGGCAVQAQTVTCPVTQRVPPYFVVELLVGVVVEGAPAAGEENEVGVSGGGAVGASLARPLRFGEATPFGVQEYELTPEEEGGAPATQAGAHPFQLTTTFTLNQGPGVSPAEARGVVSPGPEAHPAALAKDVSFKWPAGLIGNPTPFKQCTLAQFLAFPERPGTTACPSQSQVGVAVITFNEPEALNLATLAVPLYNMEPTVGEPARFAFMLPFAPVYIDTSVRDGEDYGVTVHTYNITQIAGLISSSVTVWGVPGDPRHGNSLGEQCLGDGSQCAPPPAQASPPPLLVTPTACSGSPLRTSVEADSWAESGNVVRTAGEPMVALDGCNRLPFEPSLKVTPDGTAGSTPTGLTVDEHVPQASILAAEGLAESNVKGLSVTLPEGVGLNPAGADGLQACSMEEIGLESAGAATCPEASKVAIVKVTTPLLPDPLEGAAYLATQDSNPFGSLVAMYIYAEDPTAGVRVKAAGEVLENPVTGQLTAHFEKDPVFANDPRYAGEEAAQFLPQTPFEDVELHFFGGDRAPLGTPAKCGAYTATGTFTPWSGNPTPEFSSTFNITSGPNGSPCADPLPFKPSLTAGTTSIQAGGFTPFTMTMGREDGEQNLQAVQLKMPLGMSGTLSGVKLCDEADANAGTCGPESLIGETIVSVGLGGDPYTVRGGKVYITGPYRGAPFGLSIVNPAKAGPFDLGDVVVRAKIEVNAETAALTITTDDEGPYKIPTLIDGIPLQIKHVNVNINRPGFTFNATNCSPLNISGSLTSTEGATSALSVPYQVTNCAVLAFKPKLEASTAGKWTRLDGTSLKVKLHYPAGPYDANISRVKVELPGVLPSRLPTLQKACLASVFEANPAACPSASVIGHARATTPVLPVPLEGPAYFVSHGGEGFPSLIIVLQGYGVTVHLVGTTFISKAGITSSTFKTVPDVPVGSFELNLPAGPYSALTGLGDLCKSKSLAMPTEFVGQNGAEIHTITKVAVTGCPKTKKVKHKAKAKRKTKLKHKVKAAREKGTAHKRGRHKQK